MSLQDTHCDEEAQVRSLIEGWVSAVHNSDLEGVLTGHSDDIVMFDVPPPHEGVRGFNAYEQAWPDFLDWQRSGAVFQIVSLEVTAGKDVAFAHALLRCGTPEELHRNPEVRLRLTIGLRKENERWIVTHEHHSFALQPQDTSLDEAQIRRLFADWFAQTAARDIDGSMAPIAPDVVSYEQAGDLQYVGNDEVRQICQQGFDAAVGELSWDIPDLKVLVNGDLAVAWGIDHITMDGTDGHRTQDRSRGTRVFQKRDGRWRMVHQHVSCPLEL